MCVVNCDCWLLIYCQSGLSFLAVQYLFVHFVAVLYAHGRYWRFTILREIEEINKLSHIFLLILLFIPSLYTQAELM